jgi:hypothetical protein
MTDVTRILSAIEQGDPHAAEQLLPLVYDELRRLAVQRLAHEKPGQTLQATALVHEAYLSLVEGDTPQHWSGRGHFFAAAAEAMRRILVEPEKRRRGGRRLLRLHLVGKCLSATPGGDGLGGGPYVARGVATITSSTITANTAQGGHGGNGLLRDGRFVMPGAVGGSGFGGGGYAAGGSVSFHTVTITDNSAQAGDGGQGRHTSKAGSGVGGGIYIDPAAVVALDAFTISHVKKNQASTSHGNIYGSYDRIP